MSKRSRQRTRGGASAAGQRQLGPASCASPPPEPVEPELVERERLLLDQRTATVRVHSAVGRSGSGQVRRCPPLLLERLHPAA